MAKKEKKHKTSSEKPRGFRDIRDASLDHRDLALDIIAKSYKKFGFSCLQTPVIEYADALGKFLPDVDRPAGGVFGFQDDDEKWLALRYDLTAPLARFVAHYQQHLPQPFKRYQIGSVFRNEKPGPGRFREFTQCDADIIGSMNILSEAELCIMLSQTLINLGIKPDEYVININNRKLLSALLSKAGLVRHEDATQRETALRAIDKLDRLGLEGVRLLLQKGRKDASGDFTKGADLSDEQTDLILRFVTARQDTDLKTLSYLEELLGDIPDGKQGIEELETLIKYLAAYDHPISFKIDPATVRGIGYYTGIVFEAELTFEVKNDKGEFVQFGSVAGGGRYDDLITRFTGRTVPAVGVSIGIDRLLTALENRDDFEAPSMKTPVFISIMDKENISDYIALADVIRRAGIGCDLYCGDNSIKSQMKYADKIQAKIAIIYGSDEKQVGNIILKDLSLGKALAENINDHDDWRKNAEIQKTIPIGDLESQINQMLAVIDARELRKH